MVGLTVLQQEIIECELCPRLVTHRQEVATTKKRRAYRGWSYWGRPVPSLGGWDARLLVVGLAPGAHGANRTGRMFTGDGSGDLLYSTLHRWGLCNRPESASQADGLSLSDTYITAAVHCVPPENRPTAAEINLCRRFLCRELLLLSCTQVVVALGGIAWSAYLRARRQIDQSVPRPQPGFAHGAQVVLDAQTTLLGCYHPSRQNTQTGRLTREMFEEVFGRAREHLLDRQVLLERN